MDATAAATEWLVSSLLLLPVEYAVVRTHRERSQAWWNRLSRPGTPGSPALLFWSWLAAAVSGAALPAAIWWGDEPGVAATVVAALARTLLYVLWPLVVLVSHGKGYGALIGVAQWALTVAAVVLLALRSHAAALAAPGAVWSTYMLFVSLTVWARNAVGPTPRRVASDDERGGSLHLY